MASVTRPRSGSLQFWPRVRANRIYARVRRWANQDRDGILGFAGYKAGMTHVIITDTEKTMTKGEKVTIPVTIIECPPMKPLSLRFYKKTSYGSEVISELPAKKLNKELSRKLVLPKSEKTKEAPKEYDDIRLLVYTQPKLTGIGKKKPEVFELGISGDLEYAKSLLEKDITINDVFKAGNYTDIHSITTGYGFQGVVKRFGVSLKSHKSEKKRRAVGNLGPFTPRKVSWKVPQTGQHGYHTRTEYNKLVISIGSDPKEVNQDGAIVGYGLLKNDYMLIKGSVGGPKKRMIKFTRPIRNTSDVGAPEIGRISTNSKQ